jgi:hypothetical protein
MFGLPRLHIGLLVGVAVANLAVWLAPDASTFPGGDASAEAPEPITPTQQARSRYVSRTQKALSRLCELPTQPRRDQGGVVLRRAEAKIGCADASLLLLRPPSRRRARFRRCAA